MTKTKEEYPFAMLCDRCDGEAFYMRAIPLNGTLINLEDIWLFKQEKHPLSGEMMMCEVCDEAVSQTNVHNCRWSLRK